LGDELHRDAVGRDGLGFRFLVRHDVGRQGLELELLGRLGRQVLVSRRLARHVSLTKTHMTSGQIR
jgi:hypothetical protein